MHTFYLVFVIVLVSLAVTTCTAILEKRAIWPYVPASELPPERLPAADSYSGNVGAAAEAAGFTNAGTFGHGTVKLIRIRYNFFRSPGGDMLVIVGNGTVASVPMQTTWLCTILADGRQLITLDHKNGSEIDLAGIVQEALIDNLGFAGMLSAHQTRIGAAGSPVAPFGEADPLRDLRSARQRRIDRLTALGYAQFLDADRNTWHYSVKGAIVWAFRQYYTSYRRFIVPDKGHPINSRITHK